MRIRVGATVLAAAALITVAGCGGNSGTQTATVTLSTSAAPSPAAPTVEDANTALTQLINQGCPEGLGGDCSDHLREVVAAADTIRKSMHADAAGPAFFSEAYGLINELDSLRDNYEPLDQAGTRPQVLGLAMKLRSWVRTHPSS
jgi:hypothetical protein